MLDIGLFDLKISHREDLMILVRLDIKTNFSQIQNSLGDISWIV